MGSKPSRQQRNRRLQDQRYRCSYLEFKVGDRVEARLNGGDKYFPGTITRVHPASYDILYDNNIQEEFVSPTLVRVANFKSTTIPVPRTAAKLEASNAKPKKVMLKQWDVRHPREDQVQKQRQLKEEDFEKLLQKAEQHMQRKVIRKITKERSRQGKVTKKLHARAEKSKLDSLSKQEPNFLNFDLKDIGDPQNGRFTPNPLNKRRSTNQVRNEARSRKQSDFYNIDLKDIGDPQNGHFTPNPLNSRRSTNQVRNEARSIKQSDFYNIDLNDIGDPQNGRFTPNPLNSRRSTKQVRNEARSMKQSDFYNIDLKDIGDPQNGRFTPNPLNSRRSTNQVRNEARSMKQSDFYNIDQKDIGDPQNGRFAPNPLNSRRSTNQANPLNSPPKIRVRRESL